MEVHLAPKGLAVPLLALLGLSVPALDLNACSCRGNVRPCEHIVWANAVFTGEVVEVEQVYGKVMGHRIHTGDRAHVRVEEVFAGLTATDRNEVAVDGDGGGTSCFMVFTKGDHVLFYAERRGVGEFHTDPCSGTISLKVEGAQADLDYLRARATAQPVGRISGAAWVKGGKPLKGVEIRISGEGVAREATTDEKGFYEFSDLQAGRYTIEARPPGKLKPVSGAIELIPQGCPVMDFFARDKSLIALPPSIPLPPD